MQVPPPSLSVVIPNYNHAAHLPKCLDAVLSQSVPATEIIVIDDGSTDNSLEVLRNYAAKYPSIRLYQNDKNRGAVYTINRGLHLATSSYVTFPSADDEIMPGLFEKSLGLLTQYPQAAAAATIVEFRDMDTGQTYHQGTKIAKEACYLPPEEVVEISRQNRLIVFTSTMILRREAMLAAGGFNAEFKWHTDWFGFFIPIFRHGFCFTPEVLGEFRVFSSSYSKKGMRSWKNQSEIFHKILDTLLTEKFSDVLPAIKRSGVLAPFGKEMLAVLLTNRRYRQFLTPLYLKNALWWISRIEAKKVLPRFVADMYFKMAGFKVSKTHGDASERNKVAI